MNEDDKKKEHLPLYGIGPILCFPMVVLTAVGVFLSEKGYILGKISDNTVNTILLIIGILLIIEGIALFLGADAGGNLQNDIKDNKLKTNGAYKFVRNPCYTLFLLGSTGVILIEHNPLLLIFPLLFWLEMTIVLKNTEEKWLKDLYGQEYVEYCKNVNRCIPWFPKRNRVMKIFFIVIVAVLILLLIIYINHQIHLKEEIELRLPLGQMVEVDGHNMSIYLEGTGDTTLVFMSGGGTCSPILDFKSLYSLLSDKYQIAVVEKFGYGFSDVVDTGRDIDSILEDTRTALAATGLNAPYVLCPHSMSGLEALYWAQKYPDEVSAIIGLDMAVPEYYDSMNINIPIMHIAGWAANIGVTRFIPGISDSDAIKYGTLSDDEKEIYRAIFYSRTATVTMLNEVERVKENAEKVNSMGVPQLPMLLFISDGSGGTGFDKETWRKIPIEYISQIDEGEYIELNCPHYVHDYEYETISKSIIAFLLE